MKKAIISVLFLGFISACTGYIPAAVTAPTEVSIYPGDCLKSNHLIINKDEFFSLTSAVDGQMGLLVTLYLDLDMQYKVVSQQFNIWCYQPSFIVYSSFGADKTNVENAYNELFDSYRQNVSVGYGYYASTILYSDVFSIIANKDFAGIPAGDELSSIAVFLAEGSYHYPVKPIPGIAVPKDYHQFDRIFYLKFHVNDFEIVSEDVTFHLEIPIKVGLLMAMLRDRLTNPDAEMQFRDEVLTCDFTIPRGLH